MTFKLLKDANASRSISPRVEGSSTRSSEEQPSRRWDGAVDHRRAGPLGAQDRGQGDYYFTSLDLDGRPSSCPVRTIFQGETTGETTNQTAAIILTSPVRPCLRHRSCWNTTALASRLSRGATTNIGEAGDTCRRSSAGTIRGTIKIRGPTTQGEQVQQEPRSGLRMGGGGTEDF